MDLAALNNLLGIIGGLITIIGFISRAIVYFRQRRATRATVTSGKAYQSPPTYGATREPQPYSTMTATRTARNYLSHPRIAVLSTIGVLGLIAISQIHTRNLGYGVLIIVSFTALVIGVVLALVKIIQLRRWGWLIGLVLTYGYSSVFFGIFGPTTRRS